MELEIVPSDKEEKTLETKNDALMLKVIETGNVEALERFIALREREEERQAKLTFDREFAAMQSEFQPVARSKKGYDYKYAPIEVLQKQFGPIIAGHGFSYRWSEENTESGKRCTMTISGHGYSRDNSFEVPALTGTRQMNPIQVAGAMSTYGRRYTFIAGFGIIIEDEDNDGVVGVEAYPDEAEQLDRCQELPQLVSTWQRIYKSLDKEGKSALLPIYLEKKEALEAIK